MSGFNKQVWMTVAQGGRWTAEEVKKELGAVGRNVDRALYAMTVGGLLAKFEGEQVQYGITEDCITPRMTTVGEMLQAMGVR